MDDSVIFNNPAILVGYIISFAVAVFAMIKKPHWAVSIVALAMFSAVTTGALIAGASLYEAGAVAALFFAVRLLPLFIKGGK